MGCDIHTTLALRTTLNGVDCSAGHLALDVLDSRDYFLFTLLAGVRNGWEIKPIAEPRGWPNWFAREGPIGSYERLPGEEPGGARGGDHSHSYLTMPELRVVADRYEAEWPHGPPEARSGYNARDSVPKAIRALCDYADALAKTYDGTGEAFLIFSFDS